MARPGPSRAALALLAFFGIARANDALAAEPAPAGRAESPSTAVVEPRPKGEAKVSPREHPVVRKRWALLDPFLAGREDILFGGPSSLREVDATTPLHGAAFGFGQALRQTNGPLWISLERAFDLHVYSKWTMLFGLTTYSYQAGLRLGPVEIGGGVGLNVLAIDVSDGDWSLSGLSPRASAKAGLKTGPFRVSLHAYREYYWRWLGRPDAYMNGLSIEIALEKPPKTRFAGHPVRFSK